MLSPFLQNISPILSPDAFARSAGPPAHFAPARARRRFLGLFPTWFDARHAAVSTILLTRWLVGPARLTDVPAADLDDDTARGPGWGNSPDGYRVHFAGRER